MQLSLQRAHYSNFKIRRQAINIICAQKSDKLLLHFVPFRPSTGCVIYCRLGQYVFVFAIAHY